MSKAVSYLEEQLVGIRSGNVSSDLVETIKIEYYGQKVPLKTISAITEKDRRISIIVFEKNLVDQVVKVLQNSEFNAYKFSKRQIVINIPEPSGENTQKTVTRIKRLCEDAKVSVRNIRKKFKKMNKEFDEKKLQKITDSAIDKIDTVFYNAQMKVGI